VFYQPLLGRQSPRQRGDELLAGAGGDLGGKLLDPSIHRYEALKF